MANITILIGSYYDGDYRIRRLKEEIANFKNIKIIELKSRITYPFNEDILKDDIYYFFVGASTKYDTNFLAKYLDENGKIIINGIYKKYRLIDKTLMYDSVNKIVNIPKFIKIYSMNNLHLIEKYIGYPLVIKHSLRHRGEFVYLINNREELKDFFMNNPENIRKLPFLIFQKYIPYEKDVRIIFIGEPYGGMQRINQGTFKANISQGGYGKPFELNEELKEICYKISEKLDLQIFAFDILIKDNEYYVIDIHHIFQFEGFEKYVGKNVMRDILKYLNGIRN